MSDDAEVIRRKRLAKLQGPARDRSAAATPSSDHSATTTPGPSAAPSPSTPASAGANPFSALGDPASGSSTPAPRTISIIRNLSTSSLASPAPTKQHTASPRPTVDLPTWTDSTLQRVFDVTVKPVESGSDAVYLEDLAAEISENGGEPALSIDTLDQALFSRLTTIPIANPFEYLLTSWRRIDTTARTVRSSDPKRDQKLAVLADARRLSIGYAVLAISTPDMCGIEFPIDLSEFLIEKEDSLRFVPAEFLKAMILRAAEDETLSELITPTLENLSTKLRALTMADSYQPYFRAMRSLVEFKEVSKLFTTMPLFLPQGIAASNIEMFTLLGPFLRISPVDTKVANLYFSHIKDRPASEVSSAVTGLRTELAAIQDQLKDIVFRIIQAGPEPREAMLQYFATAMNVNHKRRAMQIVPGTVSSDAFMLNMTAVLNKLAEPFVDATFLKIDKIDSLYYKKSTRIDIKEEVKLDADQTAFNKYIETRVEGAPNFISEIFYLNVACHHYGLGGSMNTLTRMEGDIKDMEKHLQKLESEMQNWVNSPQAAMLNNTLAKLREQLSTALAYKQALNVALEDRQGMGRSFAFLMTLATWLVRLVDPNHEHPQKHIALPLAGPCPDEFRNLPEYFVEDITGFIIYFSRHFPQLLFDQTHVELVTFAVTFIRTSSYIKNPYLKAKIIEVLFFGVQQQPSFRFGFLGETLNSLPFAVEHLFHMLMQFYIEIEQTGASSQFYDKFNIRYYISQIVKFIWENPVYRDKLEQESRVDVEFFVRFVALLLNDVTYLLDESLSKLAEIHKLQDELFETNVGALTPQERQEREQNLSGAERQANSYMSLANETVSIVKLFTKAVPAAFVTPEIVDRLAAMLDYNLDALVGPKCTGLKVKDPQKYHFNPRALLSDIADVYLNLSHEDPFVHAVARDGRSYRREIFTRAASILGKYSVKSSKDIDALSQFADTVQATKTADEQGEEELGEIPDEFLDPLMYTLMDDPVILPSSRVSIDRATIKSHLLSDSTDPFNRMPLKLEDVIPNVELKNQITEFRRMKREAGINKRKLDADGDVGMS
ncbi:ubiquitin elongating factor core-domain-containing protein [Limtongia smithiae]|uniref:ubiquitin elongating factor core-domain-containing protein n=1 Tax=Limtongia smithiae TaxID=1125753 RepID=UPI0034CDFC02